MSSLTQSLSRLFLKLFTDGALTINSGSEFQISTTRKQKENFLKSCLARICNNFSECPRVLVSKFLWSVGFGLCLDFMVLSV